MGFFLGSIKIIPNVLTQPNTNVIIHLTQHTTQRQQLIEVATHAPCCGTQGKTRISVEAGDPSVSEFRGFAVTRPANDGCTGMIASTAVSTCRRSVCTRWLFCPAIAKTGSPHRGETNIGPFERVASQKHRPAIASQCGPRKS